MVSQRWQPAQDRETDANSLEEKEERENILRKGSRKNNKEGLQSNRCHLRQLVLLRTAREGEVGGQG